MSYSDSLAWTSAGCDLCDNIIKLCIFYDSIMLRIKHYFNVIAFNPRACSSTLKLTEDGAPGES